MSRILVTGGDGFVGRALGTRLRVSGHDVISIDRDTGDITRRLDILGPIDHVFHLAAKTFIPESWKEPAEFYRVNTLGTVEVLELCRRESASLTFLSSYVYGSPERIPVSEDHPLRPNNPYTHGKLLAEEACRFWSERMGTPVTILRPFNLYGPGQRSEFLIPTIVAQVVDPTVSTIEVLDLEPRRDFLFVEDAIDALVMTIGNTRGGTYNLGSGASTSVAEIIAAALLAAGVEKPFRATGQQRRPDEILDLYADITRARRDLGWTPKTSIESGLRAIVESLPR